MNAPIRRCHIIGGPGSGKTTLSRQVAARLHVPVYDLDRIGYVDGAGDERPLAVRIADIARIAVEPAWVTEGIYLGWTAPLFSAADVIVWLDIPWHTAGWRIFTRHVKAELKGNNPHSGWRKLYRFMRWCRRYYTNPVLPVDIPVNGDIEESRIATEFYLSTFKGKLTHCRRPADVQAFLSALQ